MGILLVCGLFFRFYNLDKKVYWYDETCTSLWVSGYTWAEVRQFLEGCEVGVQDVLRFQQVNPENGLLKTIRALATDDPLHPPLYYGLVRLWAEIFGDSVWSIRSLSALISLLVFPCFFWLCRELFEERRVAWFALILVAVSPFHVLYAQEARQYSLWMVMILLSSVMLLRALRLQTKLGWSLYAVTIAFGMYTHTLFILVIIAHGFYVFVNHWKQLVWKPLQLPKVWLSYSLANLAGLVSFAPWGYIITHNFLKASVNISWSNQIVNLFRLIGMWGINYSSVFMDEGKALKFVEQFDLGVLASYSLRVLTLMVAVYSLYFLYFNAWQKTRSFILSLTIIPFFLLALPDLLLGGIRSGGGNRYLAPSYFGVQLAVAYLLASKMNSDHTQRRRIWQGVMALVVLCGIVSCTIFSQAESWWNRSFCYYTPRVAKIINQSPKPLLIMGGSGMLLTFSHLLDSKVRILTVGKDSKSLQVPDGFSDTFLFRPSPVLQKKLEQEEGFKIEAVDERGELWRLTK